MKILWIEVFSRKYVYSVSFSVCLSVHPSVIMKLTKRKKVDRNFLFWEMSEFREGEEVSGRRACILHQSLGRFGHSVAC